MNVALQDYNSERIFKIGQYLTKLCVEHLGFTFFGPPRTSQARNYPARKRTKDSTPRDHTDEHNDKLIFLSDMFPFSSNVCLKFQAVRW